MFWHQYTCFNAPLFLLMVRLKSIKLVLIMTEIIIMIRIISHFALTYRGGRTPDAGAYDLQDRGYDLQDNNNKFMRPIS